MCTHQPPPLGLIHYNQHPPRVQMEGVDWHKERRRRVFYHLIFIQVWNLVEGPWLWLFVKVCPIDFFPHKKINRHQFLLPQCFPFSHSPLRECGGTMLLISHHAMSCPFTTSSFTALLPACQLCTVSVLYERFMLPLWAQVSEGESDRFWNLENEDPSLWDAVRTLQKIL